MTVRFSSTIAPSFDENPEKKKKKNCTGIRVEVPVLLQETLNTALCL